MRIGILTNEYPPHVYGGAGVHVEYLTRELAALDEGRNVVRVLAFGDQAERSPHLEVDGVQAPVTIAAQDPRHVKLFDTLQQNLVMAGMAANLDIVHCHTWYSHFAGCLVKQLQNVPLVLTTHSLEPHRPWKVEQLGTAYNASSWIERTAYQNADGVVAVSAAMKHDVQSIYHVAPDKVRVIHNGIDLQQYRPRPDPPVLARFGIKPDVPFVLFVGRITRQKGIIHLVNAIRHLRPGVQVVLCAGAPDTPEIAREMTAAVERARSDSPHDIVWIQEMLPKDLVISLYTHAAIFVCPSVYEPFGIINLEAMACRDASRRFGGGGNSGSGRARRNGPARRARSHQRDRRRAAPSRSVLPRPRRRRQHPARRSCAARPHGRTGAGPRRAEVFVDQHRAADARVLRGARCRPPRAKENYVNDFGISKPLR